MSLASFLFSHPHAPSAMVPANALFLPFLPAQESSDAESVFKAQCAKCHGEHGEGTGHAGIKIKPADLRSDAVQKKSDEELFKSIAHGVGHKEYPHAFAHRGLTQRQIADLVGYIRKLAKSSKKDKP